MTCDFKTLKTIISSAVINAVSSFAPQHELSAANVADMLEYPPDSKMGDLALPCFKMSRSLRLPPPKIAQDIAASFNCEYVSSTMAQGGYFNIFIKDSYFSDKLLNNIIELGSNYGRSDEGRGKTVVIDYSSPNVAKPFHIGHLGTTVIGHSLKLLHEAKGYNCIGVNHLGDWGTQFGKLIVSYRKWGEREKVESGQIDELVKLYVKFHTEAEAQPSLDDEARAEFTKLEHGDAENTELWKWFIELSINEYKKTYRQLDISFDYYLGESFYIDKMQSQIDKLRDMGLLKIDDGASIVDLEEYGMPPCLILKRDGSTIYHTRDIAAAVYRKEAYDFEKSLYVTSAGQSLHFAQLFKVMELMGYDWAGQMTHVPYGTVSINGEKLATRTGNVILLKDLFSMAIEKVKDIINTKNPSLENKDYVAESVGVGAIVFHYLSNNRIKDINFILEDALSFEGNTGPYAQYTYARCCSILERAGGIAESYGEYTAGVQELALLKTLALFPEKIDTAVEELEPFIITRYISDICTAFNRFYHECPILSADSQDARNFRLRLTSATKETLGSALRLICLRTPEKI